MISINPFSRDGYDNTSIWIGGCIGFFGLLSGGLVIHTATHINYDLWKKLLNSVKTRKF